MFSSKCCEIFKYTYFEEDMQTAGPPNYHRGYLYFKKSLTLNYKKTKKITLAVPESLELYKKYILSNTTTVAFINTEAVQLETFFSRVIGV